MRLSPGVAGAFWRAGLAGALVLGAALLGGCAGSLAPPPEASSALAGPARLSLGVLEERWHTGLVLPRGALGPKLADLRRRFPHGRYLAFGWGQRAYYTAAHPGVGTALSALLPSRSVLFVRALPTHPERALPARAHLRWLCVAPGQMERLETYLAHYVREGPGGQPLVVAPGPWPDSEFLASTKPYDALHTCNTWTAAALHYAGLPVGGSGVLFAGQVAGRTRSLAQCPP